MQRELSIADCLSIFVCEIRRGPWGVNLYMTEVNDVILCPVFRAQPGACESVGACVL